MSASTGMEHNELAKMSQGSLGPNAVEVCIDESSKEKRGHVRDEKQQTDKS